MKHNVIFEILPYAKNASSAYAEKFIDRIMSAVNDMESIGILNIPEIVEENHIGLPYYRNFDNRKFGIKLREKCGKDIMLNTVVGYYKNKDNFEQWLDESVNKFNIRNFVFVGAKINSIRYPGPSVVDANLIAKRKDINFGNIFIPERENESDRMVSKTIAGCKFFTSQVLFESEKLIEILSDYSMKCEKSRVKPAKVYLSFSPLSSLEDINFIKWLGAEIKERTEDRLKSAQDIGRESIKIIKELLHKIFGHFDNASLDIPIGLNIEYITLHNLELSKDLVDSVHDFKIENYLSKIK